MDPLRLIAEQNGGYFTRQEALAAGYASREITRIVHTGAWKRIRRAAYVFADTWKGLDPTARHLVRCAAVMRSLGDKVVLSHGSGVVAHGIDDWGIDLTRVHVTRLDGHSGGVEGDLVHHEGQVDEADVVEVNGLRTLPPQRCVLEAATLLGDEPALCLLDSGLRADGFRKDELEKTFRDMRHWTHARHLVPLVPMADGRSGSVGESRGRWLFRIGGIPLPELQVTVLRPDRTVAGIADWGWHDMKMLGEFDGRFKYGRLLKPGQTPGDAVFEEKRREDEMREITRYGMFRLIWADLDAPRLTIDRVKHLLRIAS